MPRPRKPGGPEPKRRSRNGCWPCKTKKVKCDEERPKCMNCERQGETCDYSIRLNWEGRTKRKASERTPEPKPHVPAIKLEDSPRSDAIKIQPESARSSLPVTFGTASESCSQDLEGEVDNIGSVPAKTEINPLEAPPTVPLTSLAPDAQGDNSSRPPPSSSRDGMNPFTIPCGSESERTGIPTYNHIQFFQGAMMPPHHADARAEVWSPKRTMEGSFGDSRPLKRPRSDPPSALDISSQSINHGHNAFPYTAEFPQAFQSSAEPVRYTPGDSTLELPRIHSISSAMSISSNDTPTGCSSRSSAWSLPPILENPSDTRRLSVNALLSSPKTAQFPNQPKVYGIDKGFPDLDIPRNKDNSALDGTTPLSNRGSYSDTPEERDGNPLAEFGFGLYGKTVLPSGGEFYASPVPVVIESNLEPLPAVLLDNQMNLLYFHHFINHTARILVPHDCLENPFGTILPQSEPRTAISPNWQRLPEANLVAVAVREMNLMHLLLAYSACHRARLLKHPEPTNRIAVWVRDVFPSIRNSLSDSTDKVSTTNLAALIMLASLEIIAPAAFEFVVPWQEHLNAAREIIKARGPPQAGDIVAHFLNRWFIYLDVLGSLSGATNAPVLNDSTLLPSDIEVEEPSNHIDCLFGFTSGCINILAEIADVARRCDSVRIDPTGTVRRSWRPTDESVSMANDLKVRLEQARTRQHTACPHRRRLSIPEELCELQEMAATNDAFHWAGLIHIACRVLGKSYGDMEVVHALKEIKIALQRVRKGGTAEACLLFPIFTAGCAAYFDVDRRFFLDRITSMEGSGMAQVQKARKLMQKVWETGRPWETLVQGEFFG